MPEQLADWPRQACAVPVAPVDTVALILVYVPALGLVQLGALGVPLQVRLEPVTVLLLQVIDGAVIAWFAIPDVGIFPQVSVPATELDDGGTTGAEEDDGGTTGVEEDNGGTTDAEEELGLEEELDLEPPAQVGLPPVVVISPAQPGA